MSAYFSTNDRKKEKDRQYTHKQQNKFRNKYKLLYCLILVTFTVNILGCSEEKRENKGNILKNRPNTKSNIATGGSIRYGRAILLNTAHYLGPNGTAGHYLGNKMNCTNCHLDAGTRIYGLNFFNTYKKYPQYRGRENRVLSLADRINNCIERPHNGTPIPDSGREMKAIIAYLKWLSENSDTSAPSGNMAIQLPSRPADPIRGALVYTQHCTSCHGANGEGMWVRDSSTYLYPPLWGPNAYQKGSSPHRVLMLARFIKANMPYKLASWQKPLLTDEQAIDVAAFINNDSLHARPEKKGVLTADYPIPGKKPIDYPRKPYLDSFSENQHKFGPWQPIILYHQQKNIEVIY